MQDMRVPLLLVGLLTAAACGGDDRNDETSEAAAAQSAADSAAASSLLTPIRGMSLAEVEFADLATRRAGSTAVRQYAQTVAADHRSLITALDSVARIYSTTLTEAHDTQEMANTARLAHSGLEGLPPEEFDLPFVRAEVESHRMLLDRLDQEMIPAATNAELNGLLTDIRAMADAHLTRARQLLAQQLGQTESPQQAPPRQPQRTPPAGQPLPPPGR
jgi:predicted outer membrane protein